MFLFGDEYGGDKVEGERVAFGSLPYPGTGTFSARGIGLCIHKVNRR